MEGYAKKKKKNGRPKSYKATRAKTNDIYVNFRLGRQEEKQNESLITLIILAFSKEKYIWGLS